MEVVKNCLNFYWLVAILTLSYYILATGSTTASLAFYYVEGR